MEEKIETTKISFAKNLSTTTFNTIISAPIDSNVNIKTILDISSYIYDEKVDCINGKAIITGKIGLKILYIDTDNITNILNENQSFSETIIDPSITNDCYIIITNSSIQNEVLSSQGNLKIDCTVSLYSTLHMNLALNSSLDTSNLITKTNEISTTAISNDINTKFTYSTNIETKSNISKVLCHNAYFNLVEITSKENALTVEGKLHSCVMFEENDSGETKIKELHDTYNLKTDVPIQGIDGESILDVYFSMDKSNERITLETDADSNSILIEHTIKICGIASKQINLNLIDDAYSTENEIETIKSSREFFDPAERFFCADNISGEVTLTNEETAIDEILSNLNIFTEITNVYIKDNYVYAEGVINSTIAYIDENKDVKQKNTQIPFILNSKHSMNAFACASVNLAIDNHKFKAKRGTIIELDYNLNASFNVYKKASAQLVDNVKIGKPLDFSNYDYQIYIAKPDETMWDLCKRTKCSLESVLSQNPNISNNFLGGERVIIKR